MAIIPISNDVQPNDLQTILYIHRKDLKPQRWIDFFISQHFPNIAKDIQEDIKNNYGIQDDKFAIAKYENQSQHQTIFTAAIRDQKETLSQNQLTFLYNALHKHQRQQGIPALYTPTYPCQNQQLQPFNQSIQIYKEPGPDLYVINTKRQR